MKLMYQPCPANPIRHGPGGRPPGPRPHHSGPPGRPPTLGREAEAGQVLCLLKFFCRFSMNSDIKIHREENDELSAKGFTDCNIILISYYKTISESLILGQKSYYLRYS